MSVEPLFVFSGPLMSKLTRRQQDVMLLATKHCSQKDTARILSITAGTVSQCRRDAGIRLGMSMSKMLSELHAEIIDQAIVAHRARQDLRLSADRRQIIYALERVARALDAQADALATQRDYSAEMPAADADRMREAIEIVRAGVQP